MAQQRRQRDRFNYRIVIYIGGVDYVPTFGQTLVRVLGTLVRAGHDVKLEIREGAEWKSPG